MVYVGVIVIYGNWSNQIFTLTGSWIKTKLKAKEKWIMFTFNSNQFTSSLILWDFLCLTIPLNFKFSSPFFKFPIQVCKFLRIFANF